MEWVKAINDAIEFMEKNLTEKITLVEVADSVNISAFHFHHAFTIMTGITPAEYIRNRRLSLAGAEIAKGDKIIDVAVKLAIDLRSCRLIVSKRVSGISELP